MPSGAQKSVVVVLVEVVVVVTDSRLATAPFTSPSTRLSTLDASSVVGHGGRASASAKAAT
jgi:hypothetical protein